MEQLETLVTAIKANNYRAIARALTLAENNAPEIYAVLEALDLTTRIPVIGITGPPGAGKSTLVNQLIKRLRLTGKKVALLAVDPTSPFSKGTLLGDRLRMQRHFEDPEVFIRSVASRGHLGGLAAKTVEMIDVLKAGGFDLILIETVGVGQSEVDVAGLADLTIVVLVPESGDEIQHLKSGLMEVGDAFVVNKSDRQGADVFANGLRRIMADGTPVFNTSANTGKGVERLADFILSRALPSEEKRVELLTRRAWQLIQEKRMNDVNENELRNQISREMLSSGFNLYRFVLQNY